MSSVRIPLTLLLYLFSIAIGLGYFVMPGGEGGALSKEEGVRVAVHFAMCDRGQGYNCIIDGDTFHYQGESIRIADIDTPETYRFRCASEKALGELATRRMRELLNAGPFVIAPYERDIDQYGRKLRIIERDGQSLGGILVSEGLARAWTGRRLPWCG